MKMVPQMNRDLDIVLQAGMSAISFDWYQQGAIKRLLGMPGLLLGRVNKPTGLCLGIMYAPITVNKDLTSKTLSHRMSFFQEENFFYSENIGDIYVNGA